MNEEQTENGKKPQSNETGGLSFAVTLLAALGTISYAAYIYVQTTPINPVWYLLFRILFSTAPILAGGLLFYILINGYSMEVDDHDQKNRLKEKASMIYLVTFFSFTVLLVFLVYIFFLAYLVLFLNLNIVIYHIFGLIGFLCILFFFVHVFEWQDKIPLIKEILTKIHSYLVRVNFFVRAFKWCDKKLQSMNSYSVGFLIAIVFFAIILILIVPNLPMLQGHVTVDMESIYYKNDAPIPVLIHVTGPNPNLSIELQNSTKVVYNLELTPERNLSKTVFSNNSFLIGNALNYGTYNVFINTTNLSAGYYELVCKRPKYEKTYGARGFYLLNSS